MLSALLFSLFSTLSFAGEGGGHITVGRVQDGAVQPAPVATFDNISEAEYDKKFEMNETWSFHFHPWARSSSVNHAWEQQSSFDPREMDLAYQKSWGLIKAGYFTSKYEGTDGLNPMDIASMKDWGDPLNSPTKASLGLQYSRSWDSYDVEVSYIPWQTKSSIPGQNSAWYPRRTSIPLRTDQYELALPDSEIDYTMGERKSLNDALRNNIALRIQAHGDAGDAALAYFEGAADFPIVQPVAHATAIATTNDKSTFLLAPPIRLDTFDYRRRTTAAMLSTTYLGIIFRLAAKYEQPLGDDPLLPDWSQQTVAGLERSFDVRGNTVTAVIQGAWNRHPSNGGLISVQDIFDRALILGLRWPFGETWTVMASGFHSGNEGSTFGQLQATYRWSDHISIQGTFQKLAGDGTYSLLRIYQDNSRGTLNMTWAF